MSPFETTARARDAELCTQAFGDPTDPAILLIQGGAASMDWWEDDFCRRLAGGDRDGGRFVVRYDHRDTGRSTSYPPGEPGYTGDDLAADALAVLDAVGVVSAHLVGLSMGGALAQVIALDHPERVLSLTLIATSPVGPLPEGTKLPPMSEELAAHFSGEGDDAEAEAEPGAEGEASTSSPEAAVAALVDSFRPYAGSGPFEEDALRAVAERVVARSRSLASAGNHFVAPPGAEPARTLGELAVPALIVHGTEDPMFPLPHGATLARLIPGARLLALDGTGHELPRRTWDRVVPAILAHTAPRPG